MALKAESASLREKYSSLHDRLDAVKAECDELVRLIHGAKNERFVPQDGADPTQKPLFPESSDDEAPSLKMDTATPVPPKLKKASRKARRKFRRLQKNFPRHLRRDVTVVESKEDVSGMQRMGYEDKETLEYVRAELVVKVLRRYKYVPRRKKKDADGENSDEEDGPGGIIIAPLPEVLN